MLFSPVLLLMVGSTQQQATVPYQSPAIKYPLFKQCDAQWANDEMGISGNGERATVCREGCAMSCVAMALAGHKLYVNNSDATPGSLNTWLKVTDNYHCDGGDCNNLVLDAPAVGNANGLPGSTFQFVSEAPKPSAATIASGLASGTVVYVAHVINNSHFVLLTDVVDVDQTVDDGAGAEFYVNDPGFNIQKYPYDDISDVITYTVVPHVEPKAYVGFDQCDPLWGPKLMGSNNKTICQVGCLMSSITAGLAGFSVPIDGKAADPGLMDKFLQDHAGGFVPGSSSLSEAVIAEVSPRVTWPADGMRMNDNISYAELTAILSAPTPRVMVANVLHGGHFVLAVGVDAVSNDTVWVRDSGFNRNTYSLKEDVVGWRIFDVVPSSSSSNITR